MRYKLRTLLIVLALGPPVVAGLCSLAFLAWVEPATWPAKFWQVFWIAYLIASRLILGLVLIAFFVAIICCVIWTVTHALEFVIRRLDR